MMKTACLLAVLLLTSMTAIAAKDDNKNKERIYDAGFDKVWAACVQASMKNFHLDHSEKASGVLTMTLSNYRGDFEVGVLVVSTGENKTKVIVNPKKKNVVGSTGAIQKKFFEAVEKNLKP